MLPRNRISVWWDNGCSSLNALIDKSWVGAYFCIKERRSTFTGELRAGTVTFLTMAYIMAVNANIIADTGGNCSPKDCTGSFRNSDRCIYTDDPGYLSCVETIRSDLVTATAASSLISCFVMGAFANMPLALAPGMGLNAYFAYNVVGYRGSGNVKYEQALAAIFVEGLLFVVLALTGVRQAVIKVMPRSIMLATSSGIGLFLAFIGLQAQQGLGVSTYSESTVVTLGGCPAKYQRPTYVIDDPRSVCQINSTGDAFANLGIPSPTFKCIKGRMESATMWLGIAGFCITAIMLQRRIKGGIMIGIVFVTVIAWIPNHAASFLGSGSSVANGAKRLHKFKEIVRAPSVKRTGAALDFEGFSNGHLWLALLTFLYVDFLDCTGTLFAMANFMNAYIPGFVNEKNQFPKQQIAFVVDGIGTACGSLMGTSPISTYVESAAGIREGGRTGITALTCSAYFFISLFFVPVLSNIPPYAVGGALIIVGALMVSNVAKIPWDRIGQAIPAFLTIVVMPMTYSIAYGVVAGLVAYIVMNGADLLLDGLHDCSRNVNRAMTHARKQQGGNAPQGEDGANPSYKGKAPSAKSHDNSRHNSSDDLETGYNDGLAKHSEDPAKIPTVDQSLSKLSALQIDAYKNGYGSEQAILSPISSLVRYSSGHSTSGSQTPILTPANTPGSSQHGAQPGGPFLPLPSRPGSSHDGSFTSVQGSNGSRLFPGRGNKSRAKASPKSNRRTGEGTAPLTHNKPRRVRTQTFSDAWGDDDDRGHSQDGAPSPSGHSSRSSMAGYSSESPLDPRLLDFPGAFDTDSSTAATHDSGFPAAYRSRSVSSLGRLPEDSTTADLDLPDMSKVPSALDLKTFADLFGPPHGARGPSPPPAVGRLTRSKSSDTASTSNEATNELTMRDMFNGSHKGSSQQHDDSPSRQRGKLPVFEGAPAGSFSAAAVPASDDKPLSGDDQQQRRLRPEALEAAKQAAAAAEAASKPHLVRSDEILARQRSGT